MTPGTSLSPAAEPGCSSTATSPMPGGSAQSRSPRCRSTTAPTGRAHLRAGPAQPSAWWIGVVTGSVSMEVLSATVGAELSGSICRGVSAAGAASVVGSALGGAASAADGAVSGATGGCRVRSVGKGGGRCWRILDLARLARVQVIRFGGARGRSGQHFDVDDDLSALAAAAWTRQGDQHGKDHRDAEPMHGSGAKQAKWQGDGSSRRLQSGRAGQIFRPLSPLN